MENWIEGGTNLIIRSAVAVPIVKPSTSIKRIQKADDAYFDSPFRFVDYLYKEKFLLTADDQGDWYLLHIFDCENSEHLSGSRQIIRHDYLKDQKLPLIDLIEESGLSTNVRGYDKAFAHGLCFVKIWMRFHSSSNNKSPTTMERMTRLFRLPCITLKTYIMANGHVSLPAWKPSPSPRSRRTAITAKKFGQTARHFCI